MAHVGHLTRTQVPLPKTWVKGTVPSSLRQQPSASAVPLPGSLNAHPSKAPQTNTTIASPYRNQQTVQSQKNQKKEALPLASGELDRIRDETQTAFGSVQATESNACVDHSEDNPMEKSAYAVPLPGSLNAHPSKAPPTNTTIASPSGNQPTVQPQKKYTKEALPLAAGVLDRIREETKNAFGFVQETEINACVDHSEDSTLQQTQSKVAAELIKQLLGNDSKWNNQINWDKGAFQDNSTGLYFEIHNKIKNKNKPAQYVVTFPGSGIPGMTDVQWKNNISQITGQGGVPPAYSQAARLIAIIKSNLPEGATLELAGHSLGGGIANYTGLKHDLRSTCFNAAALGKACLEDLGNIPKDRLEKQVHIRIKSDWLSSARFLQKFQKFSSSLIPYAPRQVGRVYELNQNQANGANIIDRHFTGAFRDFYETKKKNQLEDAFGDPNAFV